MDHQAIVLKTAACAYVGSISAQDHVQGLLPHRFRLEVDGLLSVPIHNHQQSVREKRMKRILISANPKKVMYRGIFQAGQVRERLAQKDWYVLQSCQQVLKESVP